MSVVNFDYKQKYSFLKNGVKHTIKESVIDGTKGLKLVYLEKTASSFYKLYANELEKNKYEVKEIHDEQPEVSSELTEKELLKKLKEHKLEVIINYLTKERGTYKGKKVSKRPIKIRGYGVSSSDNKKVSKKSSKK
jgi:hypothetical protein